jgi:mono/diheme cytochrome c family protein
MTLLLLLACGSPSPQPVAPEGPSPALAAAPDPQIARGEAVFAEHCARCHGPEGRGDGPDGAELDPAPADLRGPRAPHLRGIPRRSIIENGREGTAMVGFAETLSPEDLDAVYALVHHWHHGPGGHRGKGKHGKHP